MPTSGNTAGEAEDFLVFYLSLSFFFHVKKSFFSISLQALFDSLKNKFACKNICFCDLFCDLQFILFIIRKFYNSKVLYSLL